MLRGKQFCTLDKLLESIKIKIEKENILPGPGRAEKFMDKDKDLTINQSAEAADLFTKMDELATRNPKVFEFFLSKYGAEMLDFYPWEMLWRTEEQAKSMLEKIIPYVSIAVSIITLIAVIVKK